MGPIQLFNTACMRLRVRAFWFIHLLGGSDGAVGFSQRVQVDLGAFIIGSACILFDTACAVYL